MLIKQLYTNCLAEAAYYIESDGEAAVIDPIRETSPYLELAKERNATIKYVLETHFHADFVSGHIDLARETGAEIVYGPGAKTGYKTYSAKDGEQFRIGKLSLQVIHTPGHTPESSCYLLLDENGKPHALFTGDTLFVGDVGRPDLLDGKITKEELAGMLYDSLHTRIKVLPDDVIVYPAHGPGSACGKNIGKETWTLLGEQKKNNYALLETDKDKFIRIVTEGLVPPPAYFFEDARINREGYESIDLIIKRNTKPLSVEAFELSSTQGALILDTRTPDEFEKSFIPGSINIGLNGTFALWVGSLLDIHREIVLVTEPGLEQESILRLARVGFEKVAGYLEGGLDAWIQAGRTLDRIESVSPEEFEILLKSGDEKVIDVRKPSEYADGHVKNSFNMSLSNLPAEFGKIKLDASYMVHCAGGYRSMIACSILKAQGFRQVRNVAQGYSGICNTHVELVTSCPAA